MVPDPSGRWTTMVLKATAPMPTSVSKTRIGEHSAPA